MKTKVLSSSLFNSTLETGVRTVVILVALYPTPINLDRLVQFDHLVVHSGDLGLGISLHPDTPRRATELIVRRELLNRSILLMEGRQLIERVLQKDGIFFIAGPQAAQFTSWLKSDYVSSLKERAQQVVDFFFEKGEESFDQLIRQHFEEWSMEFQRLRA